VASDYPLSKSCATLDRMMRGYVTFGANLGDRTAQIGAALAALPAHGVKVLGCSALYETDPVGPVAGQPPYLNGAARIETALTPLELLAALKSVERSLGRITDPADPAYVDQGPRPIDLDIALLDSITVDEPQLTVPHPELLGRRFALIPLLELEFGLAQPDGRSLAGALATLDPAAQPVRRSDQLLRS